MKTNSKLFSILLALVMTVACMAGLLTACKEDPTPAGHTHTFSTTEWESDATGHWRPATCGHTSERGSFGVHTPGSDGACTVCGYSGAAQAHTCESTCPTCGKCLNSDCTQAECAEKCGDTRSKEQEFECEDPHTILTPGTSGAAAGPLNRNVHEEGSDCTYVGGFNANAGSSIEAKIESNKAATVTILARVCKRSGSVVFTQSVGLWINEDIIERKTIVPNVDASKGEREWLTFTWCNLGCIELVEGVNSVKFQCLDPDAGRGFNFDKIQFRTDEDVALTWYEEPADTHVCTTKCPLCEKCLNPTCDRPACKEKCNGEGRSEYRFEGVADEVLLEEGTHGMPAKGEEKGNNRIENLNINLGAKVTFKINADRGGVVTLIVRVCKYNSAVKFAQGMSTTVNGTLLETPAVVPATTDGEEVWHTYVDVVLGCVNLIEGENTIVFEVISETAFAPNFATLILKSETPVSWTDGGEVARDFRFEGEDERTLLVAGSIGALSRGGDGDVGNVGNFNANVGAKIAFFVNSPEACTVKFSVSVCKRGAPVKFTDSVAVKVNDESFTSPSVVPAYDPETEGDWHYYVTVELGTISLKQGNNVIVFECVDSSAVKGFNFDAMILNGTKELTWGEQTSLEPEVKGPDYLFEAEDPHTELGEGNGIDGKTPTMPAKGTEAGVGRVGDLNANPGATLTYRIQASAAGKVKLSVSACKRGSDLVFTNSMKVTVNGTELTSEAVIPACGTDPEWNTYVNIELGEIDLVEGENVIVFTVLSADANIGFNIDSITLHSETIELSWYTAPAAASIAAMIPDGKKSF